MNIGIIFNFFLSRHTALLIVLFIPCLAISNELDDRAEFKEEILNLYLDNNYSEIERIADELRKQETRTGSGIWKIGLLYNAISTHFQSIKDEEMWFQQEAKVKTWIDNKPNSPTAYIVLAKAYYWWGYYHRGRGWAKDVQEEDWAPFREYITKSKKVLLENKEIASIDPNWYGFMIEVATSDSWNKEQFYDLFDEAVLKFPYYYPIYFSSIGYLAPRWHGSAEEIELFAQKAVELTRERENLGMYARIYWFASQALFKGEVFDKSHASWPLMKTSIDDVLSRHHDQWNINYFAYLSCLMRDIDKTKELVALIKEPVIVSAWAGKVNVYNECKNFSQGKAALTSDYNKELRKITYAKNILDKLKFNKSDLNRAKDYLDDVILKNPENVRALIELARYHISKGRNLNNEYRAGSLETAEIFLNKANILSNQNNSSVLTEYGNLYQLMNRSSDAINALDKSLRYSHFKKPWKYHGYKWLGIFCDYIGLESKSREFFDKAAAQDKHHTTIHYYYANIYIDKGLNDLAVIHYNHVIDRSRIDRSALDKRITHESYNELLTIYIKEKKYQEADAIYENYINLVPDNYMIKVGYINFLFMKLGDYDKAINYARESVPIRYQEFADAILSLALYAKAAHVLINENNATSSDDLFTEAFNLFPATEQLLSSFSESDYIDVMSKAFRIWNERGKI